MRRWVFSAGTDFCIGGDLRIGCYKKDKNDMTEKFMKKTIVVWAGALICCALWGSAFPCIKIGYSLMHIPGSDTATQILYAGYRFVLAGIMAVIMGSFLQGKVLYPTKKSIPKVIKLCMLQTVVQYLFFYIGLAHTSGVSAVLSLALVCLGIYIVNRKNEAVSD